MVMRIRDPAMGWGKAGWGILVAAECRATCRARADRGAVRLYLSLYKTLVIGRGLAKWGV